MAFGGVQANRTVGNAADGNFSGYIQIDGVTLAAWVATPAAIANADTGEFVTAAAGANQNAIPTTFGRGQGNWRAGDEHKVAVIINDANDATQGAAGQTSAISLISKAVAGGNLTIRVRNRGLQASGSLTIQLLYLHTLVQ